MSADGMSFEELKQQAGGEDPEILCELGIRYLNGDGTDRSVAKARKYLAKAAEAGNAKAMEILADTYKDDGKEESEKYLGYWYRMAITEGSASAPEKLADYYYLGQGTSNKDAAILYLGSTERNTGDC